ncbi:MAG: tryptophan-rich sensory protein [Alkalinema sp. RU_4_3]|nr:tryptophan-rich sensory protein [Alkalinema sp. RU_4_3]
MGIATLIAVFGAIGANYWVNLFPPQGLKIADLANGVYSDTLFIPANYAFAIWGLIYCGLIGFGFYQLGLSEQRHGSVLKARPWLILACLLQTLWVYTFVQQQLLVSTLLMVGLLGAIVRCYQLAEVGRRRMSRRDRLFLQHPWSLYLAWISVATIVNVSITLNEYGWDGFGLPQSLWTVVMMVVAALLGVVMVRQRRDWLYVMVVVWALLTLALRYIGIFAIASSGLLLVCALLGLLCVGYVGGRFRQSA